MSFSTRVPPEIGSGKSYWFAGAGNGENYLQTFSNDTIGWSLDVNQTIALWLQVADPITAEFPLIERRSTWRGLTGQTSTTIRYRPGSSIATFTLSAALQATTWYHITIATGPAAASNSDIHIDGTLNDTQTITGAGDEASVLGFNPPFSWYLRGWIDDLRFYNRKLIQDEITWLATGGSSGTDPTTANLTSHYTFDDVLTDAGSDALDLTAIGTAGPEPPPPVTGRVYNPFTGGRSKYAGNLNPYSRAGIQG